MGENFYQNPWAIWIWLFALSLVAIELWLRRKFEWSLLVRLLWISCLGWIVADYTRVQSSKWSQPEAIKVLVDRSDSLAQVGERKSRVDKILRDVERWASEKKLPVRVHSFGDHLLEESFSIQWGSLRSFLQPAEEIASQQEGVNILISDGLWTDYPKFRTPTFSIYVGDSNEKDLWIEKVQPVFTAFLKNRLKMPITIGQKGFTGKYASVSFWIGGEKLGQTDVKLTGTITPVEFSYFPDRMGEQTALIKIAPMEGELSALNNEVPIKIRTVRDKIRALHIGGKPSLDLKAWRAFLTRQPDVDLVSFYILRTLNDDPEAKNLELSLIPFPYEELFSTELEKFDVVILQNFDFNLYFPPFYLINLARFVRTGGSLLMIGGDQSFHRYRESPLEPLFPFSYESSGDLEEKSSSVEVVSSHPVIAGLESDFRIPTWTARHQIAPRSSATTLLKYKNSNIPFISIQDVEKGRIAAINSDELWKLQMQPTTQAPAFGKLARRLLQYLTFDPEVNPRNIISGKWRVGQEVNLQLATHEKTNWHIRSLAFQSREISFMNENQIKFVVPFPGVFEVRVDAATEARTFQTEEQPWLDEWKNLVSDDAKLKAIADETSGRFFRYDQSEKIFEQPLSGRQMVSAKISSWTRDSLSLSWAMLLLTVALMCLDFFLRKRQHWDA
jgi:hypothetical protein